MESSSHKMQSLWKLSTSLHASVAIESDATTHIGKAWAAVDRLLTIWKSDLSNKIKHEYFQAIAVSVLR